jgi:hypothetical protein
VSSSQFTVDEVDQPRTRLPYHRREYSVGPAPVRGHSLEFEMPQKVLQPPTTPPQCPRTAQSHRTQVVDRDNSRDEFVTQPAREAESEVRLHLRAEVAQTGKRQQVGLDPAKEIAGCKVEYSHGERPITAR